MLNDLPIFGVCGFSGAGKTTLIEKLIPRLLTKGLKVGVVKHDVHGIDVDRPGKDSDRFFSAGADVLLNGRQEELIRVHTSDDNEISYTLQAISRRYDIVLIEGHKNTPVTKVWLLSEKENNPVPDIDGLVATFPRDTDRAGKVMSFLDTWLPGQWMKTPVFGCVLISGGSTCIGKPKHLLAENGKTWLEKEIDLLKNVTHKVVVVGTGTIPKELPDIVRLTDAPDIQEPIAGILSAMRWAPYASWLVVACDLPNLSIEALQWLLSTRKPGVWATLPRLSGNVGIEPFLAHYDYRAQMLLEKLAAQGKFSPARIADKSKVITVSPPSHLTAAWRNINTKAELNSHRSKVNKFT